MSMTLSKFPSRKLLSVGFFLAQKFYPCQLISKLSLMRILYSCDHQLAYAFRRLFLLFSDFATNYVISFFQVHFD